MTAVVLYLDCIICAAVYIILICGKVEHLFKCWLWFLIIEVSPGLSQAPSEEPESEPQSSVLDAPEFPDFENSKMETAEGDAVDICALELEDLHVVSTDLPLPDDCGVSDFEHSLPDLSGCDPVEPHMSSGIQDVDLGSDNIIPLDLASFPAPINLSEFPEPAVPELWSQSEEASLDPQSNSQADETNLGTAELQSASHDTDNSYHVAVDDGIQPHPKWVLLYLQSHFDYYFSFSLHFNI